jgi:hypothetical protein
VGRCRRGQNPARSRGERTKPTPPVRDLPGDRSIPAARAWLCSRGLADQILSVGMPAIDLGVLPDLFPQVQVSRLAPEHLQELGKR